MNKRNTEGFALAYVVVVITVLCTLSIGLMSISLRVLQVQEKNMQRMQDKYEAQGQVECILAELDLMLPNENLNFFSLTSADTNDFSDTKSDAETAAVSAVQQYFIDLLAFTSEENIDIRLDVDEDTCRINCTVESGDTSVCMVYDICYTITVDDEEIPPADPSISPDPTIAWGYSVDNFKKEFVSYKISSLEGGNP